MIVFSCDSSNIYMIQQQQQKKNQYSFKGFSVRFNNLDQQIILHTFYRHHFWR
jgi:hypothetical protein